MQAIGGLSRFSLLRVTKHDSITNTKRDSLRAH